MVIFIFPFSFRPLLMEGKKLIESDCAFLCVLIRGAFNIFLKIENCAF